MHYNNQISDRADVDIFQEVIFRKCANGLEFEKGHLISLKYAFLCLADEAGVGFRTALSLPRPTPPVRAPELQPVQAVGGRWILVCPRQQT